jgi:hypothetical protein
MRINGNSRIGLESAMIDPQLDNIFTNLRDLSGRVESFRSSEPAAHLILDALALASGVTEHLQAAATGSPARGIARGSR